VRVPRLGDLLDLQQNPRHGDVHFLLELKSEPAMRDDPAARAGFVEAVVTEVVARGLSDRTILHSFDWRLLEACRRAVPEIPTSFLSELPRTPAERREALAMAGLPEEALSQPRSLPQIVAQAGGQLWCPHARDVTPALVEEARALGLIVLVWTVNETEEIDRMIAAGVDGIVTDYPGRVQHRLRLRGASW